MTTAEEIAVKEIAVKLETITNSFSTDQLELLASTIANTMHRTLQQNFMKGFVVPLLREWATQYKERQYDPRNEATVGAANILFNKMKEEDLYFPMI